MAPVASRIVLKVLFLARISRPDLMCAVNTLTRCVTKWTLACDRRLERLICYVNTTKHWVIKSIVGDTADKLKLAVYSDVSFAGDLKDSKSTSGGVLVLVGPSTFVPLTWVCKKQGAVSHSSTEAEIIALEAMMRMDGLPCLSLVSNY